MRTVLKLKLSDHFNQMLLKNLWWSSNFYPLSTSESTTFNMGPPPSILYNQSTGRIDNRGFQGYQNSVNSGNWLIFLSISAFRATKILSTVGLDIPIDRRFQSYQNPVDFKSWNPCSFQNYLTIGKTLCFPSAIRVDRATLNLEDIMLPVSYQGWQLWLWGLLDEGGNYQLTVGSKFPLLLFLLWFTQSLLKAPGPRPFRASVIKLRCPLMCSLSWWGGYGAVGRPMWGS